MEVLEITTEPGLKQYDDFVLSHPYGTLHQTRHWAEFQVRAQKHSYRIFGVYEKEVLYATALVMSIPLPLKKKYFYAPRGPLYDPDHSKSVEACEALLKELEQHAKKENVVYFRIDPSFLHNERVIKFFHDHSFRRAHVQHQPEVTLKVDLRPSEEEILVQMKPKGRYNIRLAEKHGVTVSESTDVESFYKLLTETTARDKFHGHGIAYYKTMLELLGAQAKLFIATYNHKPIAAAITTYCKETATYYYGASSNEDRNVMAPYLLHWEIMRDAKRNGFLWYDFFGIAPTDEPDHPWAKISDFKRKFGGIEERYVGAWERVFQPVAYHAMRLAKRIRA